MTLKILKTTKEYSAKYETPENIGYPVLRRIHSYIPVV
jgi:hypothetical protein